LLFRNHGIVRERELLVENQGPWYYKVQELEYNYRLTDIQAVLSLSQLQKLDRFLARQREIASLYSDAFAALPGVELPYQAPCAESAWHLYRRLGNPDNCNLQSFYCPHAEELYERMITLPLFPAMIDRDVTDVITAVYKVISWARRR
jgi:dTDP-4-amino-4,6-dideoxygalactose transaminase